MAVHQPSVPENAMTGSLNRANKYPYCVPSYDPTALDGGPIERWMENDFRFSETDCDVYEIEGGQGTWRTNRNDAQMQEYLHVLITLSLPLVSGRMLAEETSPIEKG